MCCKKKQKRNAGMTLIELMVAVALLAVVFLAIIRLCGTATMMAINSRKMTALVYAAEMNMEQLIGLSRDELLEEGLNAEKGCATMAVALEGGVGSLNADDDYWILLDDGNQPTDYGSKSRFIVVCHKEELSGKYSDPEMSAAFDNLVRITIIAQEIPRDTNENVMSYTLTNVIYPMVEEVTGS